MLRSERFGSPGRYRVQANRELFGAVLLLIDLVVNPTSVCVQFVPSKALKGGFLRKNGVCFVHRSHHRWRN